MSDRQREPDLRTGSGQDGARERDLAEIEAALVALRRARERRMLALLAAYRGERGPHQGRSDLPDGVYEFLDTVAEAGGRGQAIGVTEAAEAMGSDQPRASRLAAQAVKAGLVRRRADQRDGRRSLLALTERGRRRIEQISEFRRQILGEAVADWSDEDRATLARLLPRLVRDTATLTAQAGPPQPPPTPAPTQSPPTPGPPVT